MPFQFIGSTGVLRPGQCQNDIWITQGDPNFPVLGDARFILQATNPTTGIIYRELWNPVANAWQVWPMLPPLRAINASLNPNIPLLPVVIANNQITNQFRGAAIITGYQFPWNITFYLDVNIAGVQLFYIRHASRQGQEIYLNPLPGAPQLMGVNRLKWGVQINQFRAAWS